MTIPVSTMPQAVSYLFAAVQAQVAGDDTPADIYVCVGEPGVTDPLTIIEVAASVSRQPSIFAMVGDGGEFMIYEKYAIIYKVSSAVHGATAQEAALPAVDRAWQMVAYIETAVRLDPSFDGLLVEAIPGQIGGGEAVYTDGAWLCELTGRVQCEATL